jgi:ferrous iron transport protein B
MPLVIELPTYQMPRLIDVLRTACLQSWWFVKKAGTIILLVNIILWALMYYPRPTDPDTDARTQVANSYAGRLGHALTPISHLAGFDWRDNVALIGGVAAKEVIVSSLSTVYGIESSDEVEGEDGEEVDERLVTKLQSSEGWSPLKAFAMLLFVMIYAPCIPTCAVIRKETGSYKYMLLAIVYSTTLAFVLAVAVYQIGCCFG